MAGMTPHSAQTQADLDEQNASFWDELCGSALARRLGIQDASAESLARFDAAYLAYYPYLDEYIPDRLDGERVLEIGLGYGTLAGELIRRGADYTGLDIAPGPVAMARHRLALAGIAEAEGRARQGSALELPYPDAAFDRVFTIGCLHHTGDIPRAVNEAHRVLRPGGTAVVMLYHRHSFRRLVKVTLPALVRHRRSDDQVAALYDTNLAGEAAPLVEYVSRRDVRRMFWAFSEVRIDSRNFDRTRFIRREWMLGTVDRLLGTDLYITAVR
jgi:SAM-dependent methyltransferase